jgi:hypothetical protein
MRTLSPSLRKNIAGRIVRPAYLLTILTTDGTYYRWISSGTAVQYNGLSYSPKDFNIRGLNWEMVVGSQISITISNFNKAMSTLALSGELGDAEICVHIIYLYEKQVFYTIGSSVGVQLQYSLAVTEPIPSDIPQIESLRYYRRDGSIDYIGFNSWKGNRFTTYTTNWLMQANVPLYIYKYDRYNETDATLAFEGTVDDIELTETTCNIAATSQELATQFTPRERIVKSNTFNHLPIPGTKIKMFDEIFELERPRV